MKIVEQSATLEQITPHALLVIERAARTCYKSEEMIAEGSAKLLVKKLMKSGHYAMLELADATFRFVTDRGVSHELVRHRMCSFAQESTRYCNYVQGRFDSGITLIHPDGLTESQRQRREDHFGAVQQLYEKEIAEGLSSQIARGVLPNALKTEIVMKANFREWLHIFELRTSPKAHPQMVELMKMAQTALIAECPEVFGEE